MNDTTRRGFCRSLIGSAISLALSPFAKADKPALPFGIKPIHRWDNGAWVQVRMVDLRKGDKFKIAPTWDGRDGGIWKAASDPYRVQNPFSPWGIEAIGPL
jgi:hypothetical protein